MKGFQINKRIRLLVLGGIIVFAILFISRISPVRAAIADGANAVDLLGEYDGTSLTNPQPIYTKSGVNDSPNRLGFSGPTGAVLDSVYHRFFLSDTANSRVLIYNLNTDNTFPDRIADNVLGQPNFVSNTTTVSQSRVSSTQGLAFDSVNNRLFVADSGNNRVLIFDVSTITNGQNASNVLGQSNFTSNSATTTQSGMNTPVPLAYDTSTGRLFVGESTNRRVTVFNVTSTTDGQNAANVLGQINFTTNVASNTQSGINTPSGLAYDNVNGRLFVAATGNNRVTIFSVPTTTVNGQAAVGVLGQSTFTATAAATTQVGMSAPRGVVYDSTNNRLYASDFNLNRITVYDAAPAAAPLANSAGTPVVSSPTLSTLNLTFSTNSNSASTTYAIFNTTTNAYVAADGSSNSSTPVYFSSSSWSGVVSGLSPNTAYQFSVIARNSDGINAATSSVSSAVYTLSSVPTSLSTTLVAPDVISLAWAGDSSAYYITNETLATASGWVANLSFSFSGLNCNTTFVFSVKGRNGAGVETASSTAVSATTGACSTVGVPAGFTPSVVYVPSGVQTITPVNSVLVIPIVSSSLPVPFIPIIYSPQEDLFLRSFYPASDVQFIQLPVSSVLFSRQFLRYAYLFTNQDKARTVSVVREIVNDKGVIIARSGGKRSLKAGQSFSYTPSPTLIASFWKSGIYTFRIRVNDIAGHLISINAFRFQIQKR
jgi:sugar lactone lactonase YvrE